MNSRAASGVDAKGRGATWLICGYDRPRFPVMFAQRPSTTADFYERLGFVRHVQLPPNGEPGYIGLRRCRYEVAAVDMSWPADQYGGTVSAGMRLEMFIYVDDVDAAIEALGGNSIVLREPRRDAVG